MAPSFPYQLYFLLSSLGIGRVERNDHGVDSRVPAHREGLAEDGMRLVEALTVHRSGSTRLTVAVIAPERSRPSDGEICALLNTAFAVTCGPGTLCNVPATWIFQGSV